MAKVWRTIFILFLVGLVIGALVGAFLFARSCGLVTVKPVIERSLPENVLNLYEVQTTSRVYLAEQSVATEESVTLTNYWVFDNGSWHFVERTKTLLRKAYGEIKVKPPLAPPE